MLRRERCSPLPKKLGTKVKIEGVTEAGKETPVYCCILRYSGSKPGSWLHCEAKTLSHLHELQGEQKSPAVQTCERHWAAKRPYLQAVTQKESANLYAA